ncbi:MAG: 50S ribosomal protein L22 [Candidatus Heimdallarchaeota archaeon]|nr:MAG: 50S ribosomal protein L22 [Candidatus Heimdallarchaeota archaeon]
MPNYKISVFGLDVDRTAVATGRNLRISPKHAREICRELKGKYLESAQEYLGQVIEKERSVPFRRYRKKIPHRSDLLKWPAGRYPQKAAREILRVLENVEQNSSFKGLEVSRLRITHMAAQRGRKIKGFTPRAHGRSSPSFQTLTHVEVVVTEE